MVLISVILLASWAGIGQSQSAGPAQTNATPAQTQGAPAQNPPSQIIDISAKPAAPQTETKPVETKQAETKTAETKPAETKPAETKPVDAKQPDAQPSSAPAPQAAGKKPSAVKATNKKDPKADPTTPTTDVEKERKVYRIGPLDVLIIRVWDNPNLTGTYDVRSDGLFSMQLIGEVKTNNLTVQELKEELTKRIIDAGQKNPDVDVQVVRVNSKKYYVTGAVRKTGEFPLPEPITVLDAIILAGGPSEFAKQNKCYLLRNGRAWYFDYKKLLTGKDMSKNYVVVPGDRIVIPGE